MVSENFAMAATLRLAMDADGQTLLALREHSFFRGPPDTLGEATAGPLPLLNQSEVAPFGASKITVRCGLSDGCLTKMSSFKPENNQRQGLSSILLYVCMATCCALFLPASATEGGATGSKFYSFYCHIRTFV